MLEDMKCSNCSHDMIQSHAGWLCISCGHIESLSAGDSAGAAIATGKDGHAQSRAAAAEHALAGDKTTETNAQLAGNADVQPAPESEDQLIDNAGTPADSTDAQSAAAADAPVAETGAQPTDVADADTKSADPAETPPPPSQAAPWETAPVIDAGTSAGDTEAAPEGERTASDSAEPAAAEEPKSDETVKESESAEGPDYSTKESDAPEANKTELQPESTDKSVSEPEDRSGNGPDDPQPEAPKLDSESHSDLEPAPDIQAAAPGDQLAGSSPAGTPPAGVLSSSMAATASTPMPVPTPVPSTAPQMSQLPLNGKPPLNPVTHPHPFEGGRFLKAVAITLMSLAVVGAAAGAGYLYMVAPGRALSDYLTRVTGAKTGTFAGDLTSSGDGYRFTLKLDGKNDFTDTKKPKVDLGITGEISASTSTVPTTGETSSGSVSGHIVVADQNVYFKLLSISFLAELLPANISQHWYKYNVANIGNNTNAGSNTCSDMSNRIGSSLSSKTLSHIPFKQTTFAGIETVNGTQSLHYRGAIDISKIKAAVDQINKNLTDDCKLDVSADDYKDLSITYDLWRGWGKDRLKLNVTNSAANKTITDVTLDTAGYNKPIKIDAPADAKPIEQLLSDIQAKTLGAETERSGSIRDDSRKIDLARLRTELNAYATAHKNIYPATAVAVGKLNFSGIDPTTLKPYDIVAGQPTVGQIQYRRSAKCDPATGAVVPIKPAKPRTFAVATQLEGTGASYCLEAR
jgi:hypothetical protein